MHLTSHTTPLVQSLQADIIIAKQCSRTEQHDYGRSWIKDHHHTIMVALKNCTTTLSAMMPMYIPNINVEGFKII